MEVCMWLMACHYRSEIIASYEHRKSAMCHTALELLCSSGLSPLYLYAVIHAGRPFLLSASFKSPVLVFTSRSTLALLVDANQPSSSTQPP
jgi:hypothetical protein